tara:strand:+ start:6561 stop:8573 length:2013 start_codon:yes stop_codon:yes gene_type:complete
MQRLITFFLALLIIGSCKKDIESPSWDIDIIFPISHSKIDINNIVSDSNITIENNQSGIANLIFQQELLNIKLDTLVKIDAIADEQTHTLDSASFEDVEIIDTATIGNAINEIPLLSFLLPNGSTNQIPYIPNIANQDTMNIDASDYFETMTLYKGNLSVEIENNYPTDISNINITLINVSNQNIIANFNFPLIETNTSAVKEVSIAGQTIDENLYAILNNMDVNESNGAVLIDYSDAIITTIKISDIGITEATAIFPEQQLTESYKEHSFDLGGAQIREIKIKEGTVKINVLSTLPNGKMVYNIPSLTKNGVPFTSGDLIIPEANSTNLTTFSFNFDGYVLDLTGQDGRENGDTINTIYTESFTFIDYTGNLEEINQADSFYSFIEFDLTTEYAKGYLGQQTFDFTSENIQTNLFNSINSGELDLNNSKISISIDNFIGANCDVMINELTASNENIEVSANINNSLYNIDRAYLIGNEIVPSNTQIDISSDEIIEILPTKISTSASFYLNKDGFTSVEDFVYPEFPIKANLNVEIPLEIIANKLTFIDTAKIDLPKETNYEIEKVYLSFNNGFPLEAKVDLIILDHNNLIIDTILQKSTINSAFTDENNIVTENSETTLEIKYSDLTNAKKLISIASFSTKPENQHVNIYPQYRLDINLSAKINSRIGN